MMGIRELKEDIRFDVELCGHELSFATTWGLFSPKKIDDGSYLLLKHIKVGRADAIIDLGCGYGAIGIALAKLAPDGEVHMVDKDFVAVEYAKKNARLNRARNVEAYLSNGFSKVPKNLRFDHVVSNVPAKVGREMISIMLMDAKAKLKPGGTIWLVTINGLRDHMKRRLKETFGNYKKVKQGKDYAVAKAIKE